MPDLKTFGIERWAEFSEEGPPRCRFALGRDWIKSKGAVLFVGLNPSRADAETDDMTVTKGIGFAARWGFGRTIHVNAYPFITPYPASLGDCTEAELRRNDSRMLELAATAKLVVLAWGFFPKFAGRFKEVSGLLNRFQPVCLGRTKEGFPRHISRIGYASEREAYQNDNLIKVEGTP